VFIVDAPPDRTQFVPCNLRLVLSHKWEGGVNFYCFGRRWPLYLHGGEVLCVMERLSIASAAPLPFSWENCIFCQQGGDLVCPGKNVVASQRNKGYISLAPHLEKLRRFRHYRLVSFKFFQTCFQPRTGMIT
jgi:hypothetical protein